MNDNQKYIMDLFDSFKHTSQYKDSAMMEIMLRRQEFERNLDEMWASIGRGGLQQVAEYRKGIDSIKAVGLVVLRNSAGKHKIVHKM